MKVICSLTGNSVQVAGIDPSGIQEETSAFGFQFVSNTFSVVPDLIDAIDRLVAMCEDHDGYSQSHSINVNGGGRLYITVSKPDYNFISMSLNNVRILVSGTSYKFKAISTALKKSLRQLEASLEIGDAD